MSKNQTFRTIKTERQISQSQSTKNADEPKHEPQIKWKLIHINRGMTLPQIQKNRQRVFNNQVKDQRYNPSQVNLQNIKNLQKCDIQNHIKILQFKITNLKTVLLNLIKNQSLIEKFNNEQQLNLNKHIEHIIGLIGNICKKITIEFSKVGNVVNCQHPLNQEQLNFFATEAILMESNIFIFTQMENYFNECLTIFNYNNQIQNNQNLYFNYIILDFKFNNASQLYKFSLIIQAYDSCLNNQEKLKKEQSQKSIDIFTKKFGKKGHIDEILISINNVLTQDLKKNTNQLSFIQNQTISKALKIAKEVAEQDM